LKLSCTRQMANAFFLSPQYTEMAGALIVGEMKMNGRCTKVGTGQ